MNNSDIFYEELSFPRLNGSIISLHEDEDENGNESISSNSFLQLSTFMKPNNLFAYEIEKKTTNFCSNERENNSQTTPLLEEKEPKFCSLSEIEEIMKSSQIKIKLDKNIENTIEYYYMKNKTKRDAKKEGNITYSYYKNSEPKKNKRGKKPKDNSRRFTHWKFSPDNIIKKIKDQFFSLVISFLNKILNLEENNNLSKLDYEEYINQTNKNKDLNYLRMPLKDFVCMNISPKCKIQNKNNEIVANKSKENNDIINYFFEMSLNDFLEFLTYRIELKSIFPQQVIDENEKIIKNIIEFKGLENLIKYIMDKNEQDIKYLTIFLFYLYNYKRYFFIKKSRTKKENKIKIKFNKK